MEMWEEYIRSKERMYFMGMGVRAIVILTQTGGISVINKGEKEDGKQGRTGNGNKRSVRSGSGVKAACPDSEGVGGGAGGDRKFDVIESNEDEGKGPGASEGGFKDRTEAILRGEEFAREGDTVGPGEFGVGDLDVRGSEEVCGGIGVEPTADKQDQQNGQGAEEIEGRRGVPCGSRSEGIPVGGIINEEALEAIEKAMRGAEEAVERVMRTIRVIKPVFERMLAFEAWGNKNEPIPPKTVGLARENQPVSGNWHPEPGVLPIRGVPGAKLPELYPGGVKGSSFVKWDERGEPLVAELTYEGGKRVWFEIERAGDIVGTLWTSDSGAMSSGSGDAAGVGSSPEGAPGSL
jgi:hypothetical protein